MNVQTTVYHILFWKNQQSKKVKSVDPDEKKVLYTGFLVFTYLLQVYIYRHIGVNIIVYKYFQPFVHKKLLHKLFLKTTVFRTVV